MSERKRRTRAWRAVRIGGLLLAAGGAGLWAERAAPTQVHIDAQAVEKAAVAVTAALLREDTAAAKLALEELQKHTRELGEDDRQLLTSETVNVDMAFHNTIRLARLAASRGDHEETYHMNIWVQRSCFRCHAEARKHNWFRESESEETQAGSD